MTISRNNKDKINWFLFISFLFFLKQNSFGEFYVETESLQNVFFTKKLNVILNLLGKF